MTQNDQTRRFLSILLLAAVPFAAMSTLLLTSIFGPSDLGVRCTRAAGTRGQCHILQTRFLGLALNSSFPVPETDISGARTVCARNGVGAHASAGCTVELQLNSGRYRSYPVLSYPFFDQAEASTRKLNAYFIDPTRPSIELKDRLAGTVFIAAGAPVLIIGLVLALRLWLRRRRVALPDGR